jgi:hypothetical protein
MAAASGRLNINQTKLIGSDTGMFLLVADGRS